METILFFLQLHQLVEEQDTVILTQLPVKMGVLEAEPAQQEVLFLVEALGILRQQHQVKAIMEGVIQALPLLMVVVVEAEQEQILLQ
tara:strand:+ start:234 stop:494 length:261 start_codon:yes stop_codon:yes gene_type:complete